ncbi:MAG: hypothetical protein R6X32_06245 [Chloroflexota bacterium]
MKFYVYLLLLFLLLAAPVVAQTETPTPTAASVPSAITIGQIQPSQVSNVAAVDLVVTGSGFAEGAVVILGGYGALSTTYVSPSMLRALLPAEVAAGSYALTVTNPDAVSATLANGLTITAPAAATGTPVPTNTPAPTAFIRPLLVVHSYGASSTAIVPGENLDFEMTLHNAGQQAATNIIVTFANGDFTPRNTGGVRAVDPLGPGQQHRFFQPLNAGRDVSGQSIAVLEVAVTYTDPYGTGYSENFSLTFPVYRPPASGPGATATPTPTATPTATPAPRLRAQLLITDYGTDLAPLQPGNQFNLRLTVQNQGSLRAKEVTMILGGGSLTGGNAGGTPDPGGGLSGGGGDFGNFAPVGSSNVQAMGSLAVGASATVEKSLIVNASAKSGAYPVKITFVYTDDEGHTYADDQVITLLVYQLPQVDLAFYSEPPPFFAGEMAPLPLQVTNIGRSLVTLGNFRVTAVGSQLMNNSIFVGSLEAGGYFPLDALLMAEQPGPLDLIVSIDYTDDFNQPQTISRTLKIEVMESFMPEPGEGEWEEPGGFEPFPAPAESFTQKLWRFIKGLLGLSSGPATPSGGDFDFMPMPGPGGDPHLG